MTQPPALAELVALSRQVPEAALTTASRHGLRTRLVHPLWHTDGDRGWFLTDGHAPKANDIRAARSATLAWHRVDRWALAAVSCTLTDDPTTTAEAIRTAATRADGYDPADFWHADVIGRLVVVDITLDRLELTRFTEDGPEVRRWRANADHQVN